MNIANKLVFAALLLVVLISKVSAQTPNDLEPPPNPFSWVGDVWIDERGAKCSEHYENYKFVVCIRETHYSFSGNTFFQIQVNMEQSSPIEDALAEAYTRMGWSFKEDGECFAIVDTVITLPKLEHDQFTKAEIVAKWDAFYDALKHHEYNHHKISVLGYWNEFKSGCNDPDLASQSVQILQDEYDAYTNHGRTEGAIFWE